MDVVILVLISIIRTKKLQINSKIVMLYKYSILFYILEESHTKNFTTQRKEYYIYAFLCLFWFKLGLEVLRRVKTTYVELEIKEKRCGKNDVIT